MGLGGQSHAPAALPQERPGTHCIVGWLGPRAGLDRSGKSRPPPPTGIRSPDFPARSQSLYRLSYPAHRRIARRGVNVGNVISRLKRKNWGKRLLDYYFVHHKAQERDVWH